MKQAKKKKKILWQQYVGKAVIILIGVICGVVTSSYFNEFIPGIPFYKRFTVLLVGVCLAFLFNIIMHEIGHLVFGLLTGYRFSSFRIGSFMWMNEGGKLKFKRLKIAGTGGQCLMIPPDMKDGKIPLALFNLGGSFANIIVGVLFLVGQYFCSGMEILSSFLFIFALVAFISAVINGVPMRLGVIDNDGYNAFALSKNKEAIEAFSLQLKVVEQNSKGIRLKDMPAEWFAVPTDEAMKNSMVATRGVFVCNRLMDEEKFEEADLLMKHLLEIESGIVGLHRNLLVCDRMYVELIRGSRREVIESMMTVEQTKFMNAMKRFPSVLRTQYTLALLADRDTVKAEKIMIEFEKVAKNYPYPQDIESERDLMRIAESKTDAKIHI